MAKTLVEVLTAADNQRLVNLLTDYLIEARNPDHELVAECNRILGEPYTPEHVGAMLREAKRG